MSKEQSQRSLMELYGKKAFLKVKSALEIDKIVFSFVNKENPKDFNDIYVNADDFDYLMYEVQKGILARDLQAEKAKGEQYPQPSRTTGLGGFEKDGKVYSRSMDISAGSTQDIVFTAYVREATKDANGLYVPVKGAKPLSTLRVGTSYSDIIKLMRTWQYLGDDYYRRSKTVEAYKNNYKSNNASVEGLPSVQTNSNISAEEENTPSRVCSVKTTSAFRKVGSDYLVDALTDGNETVVIVFDSEAQKVEHFEALYNRCNVKQTAFKFNGYSKLEQVLNENKVSCEKVYFKSFEK